jgi:hypothetical protein
MVCFDKLIKIRILIKIYFVFFWIFTLFLFIIDRNNGNWLVKYEVKTNNERDMVGGQAAVSATYTLFLLRNTQILFFFPFFYFVVCIASAPPFALESTTAARPTGNRVNHLCIYITRLLSFIIFYAKNDKNN